jgi:hypothetical protein
MQPLNGSLVSKQYFKQYTTVWLKFRNLRILESQVSQRHPSSGNITIKDICGNGHTLNSESIVELNVSLVHNKVVQRACKL